MHGNEIMNTLIISSNLVSLRSTSMAHWERTRGGSLAHAYSVCIKRNTQNTRFSTCCLLLGMLVLAVVLCDCLNMCFASRMGSGISVHMSVLCIGSEEKTQQTVTETALL